MLRATRLGEHKLLLELEVTLALLVDFVKAEKLDGPRRRVLRQLQEPHAEEGVLGLLVKLHHRDGSGC